MSFILTRDDDTVTQVVPPKGSTLAKDFFDLLKDFSVVRNANGSISAYLLNTPICMSIITNHVAGDHSTVSQTLISPNGYSHFQRTITKEQLEAKYLEPQLHSHNYSELVYVMDGAVTELLEDETISYSGRPGVPVEPQRPALRTDAG